MTAERHNLPQHALNAKQARNAEDCKASVHSGPTCQRLGLFVAATALASFILNEIWEMAQMPAYVETAAG